jgi:hypothetical protein
MVGEKGLQERAGKKEDQASGKKKPERIGPFLGHRKGSPGRRKRTDIIAEKLELRERMAETSFGGVVQLASANTSLISCRDAKNKRVGVFAV